MRSESAATIAALQAIPEEGGVTRELVVIHAKNSGGSPKIFGFWNGLGTVTFNVYASEDGSIQNRTFVGDGSLIEAGDIVITNELTIPRVSVELSRVHETVRDMIFNHDIGRARIEIYRPLYDPDSRDPVDTPWWDFVGIINKAPARRPAAGGNSSVTLDCVDDLRKLTRVNPELRSQNQQRKREHEGVKDDFHRFINQAHKWSVPWGEK